MKPTLRSVAIKELVSLRFQNYSPLYLIYVAIVALHWSSDLVLPHYIPQDTVFFTIHAFIFLSLKTVKPQPSTPVSGMLSHGTLYLEGVRLNEHLV